MRIHRKKNRILKLLISLCCYVYDVICCQALRMLGRKPDASCVILYYHSVPDMFKKAFARQMDIVINSTIPISLEKVPQLLPGNRYAAITFDDGFEDIIRNAISELQNRGLPATVFLAVDYLGKFAKWWPISDPERQGRIAHAESWRQIKSDLISFGSHTITHPYLSSLSEKEARNELSESRVMLQKQLNRKISTFSFPYGDFNADLVEWCRDAGYQRVFTTIPGNAFRNGNEFVSGRVNAEPTDWPLEFRLKLYSAYRWLPYAVAWKHKILIRFSSRPYSQYSNTG